MRVPLDYGCQRLELSVPRERVRAVVEPRRAEAVDDVGAAVRQAVAEPVAGPPLADVLAGARRVLLLTVDHTRPSPRPLLEPLLEECDRAGAEATVCVAIGRHRAMTEAELLRHLGRDILRRRRVVQHDPFDRQACRHLGTTRRGTEIRVNRIVFEHDRVLGVGTIEPSYLAGWSGGRKLLMPGVAWCESIDQNHALLADPATRIGRLRGNPLSEDAEEFAAACPFHFICYALAGPGDEVVGVVAGEPRQAHEHGCRRGQRIYRVEAPTAPIVVASPGGYPYDCDLVQAKKAVIPAIELVEPGGAVVLLGECAEGLGAEETFVHWLRTKSPEQAVADARRRELFSLGAHGASLLARPIVEKDARVVLVTRPQVAGELEGSYLRAVSGLEAAWELATRRCGEGAGVVVLRGARRLIVRAARGRGGDSDGGGSRSEGF